MEEPIKVCIYARVSTSQQDFTHQLTSLRAYAKELLDSILDGKRL